MHDVPLIDDLVRGASELERTTGGLLPHRLPAWARAQGDAQLSMSEAQPSGVRLALRTAATTLELETLRTRVGYVGLGLRPEGVYDLVVDDVLVSAAVGVGGRQRLLDPATGRTSVVDGPPGVVRFEGLEAREKTVEIWLPWNEVTELVALRADAPVSPAPTGVRRIWLHHGSSISQGSNADGPGRTWPAVAARTAGVDLVNLGVGGSAMVDPFMARVLRDSPADLVSVKLGVNVVNADVMRRRAFTAAVHGFLDTIRDGHPDTPLILIGPLHCPVHEHTPGPGAVDTSAESLRFIATGDPAEVPAGRLTLHVVREVLEQIVAQREAHDPHLSYLDGRVLFGEDDHTERPLPDGLHPDAESHLEIGRRFAAVALSVVEPLRAGSTTEELTS